MPMHALLERQLRKAGFGYDNLPTDSVSWKEFLARIERSYTNADRQRQLLEQGTIQEAVALSPQPVFSTTPLPIHLVLSAMSDGLCVFDKTGNLLFANCAAEYHLGIKNTVSQTSLPPLVLERFELREKTNPDVRLATAELLRRLAEGQSFRDPNACLQQMGNQYLPVSCVCNPLFENHQITGFVLLFSDISDIKNVEAELRTAKETAEKASRAKSQFLSSMSHELRTPMNAILGYSELLKEDLSVPLEDFEMEHIQDMHQYVENILQAGWHLLELINKVLDLTRIEAGHLEFTIEKVELIDLIKDCISIVLPQSEKRAITIQNDTATSAPRYALADRERLKQVIINLLSNAVKYNQQAGTITIRLTQPYLDYLRLEVIDTGIGLSPDQQTKVFDPFTRLSGLNLIEGTGIGLTITKELLELMDGRIGVESETNVGSTFWIELPTGEKLNDSPSRPTMDLRKYILLYIEDSRTNVSLVAQILKARPDIALMSAHTGEMGLELAHMHHPDAILLDINLPGMDGYEVLKRLHDREDTCQIPVLALTANDSSRHLERGREAGFFNYIIKPLDIKLFLEAIDRALGKSGKS